MELILCHH